MAHPAQADKRQVATAPAMRGGYLEHDAVGSAIDLLNDLAVELDSLLDVTAISPHLRIASHVMLSHIEGRLVTPTSAVAAAGVPYATAVRRLNELIDAGFIDQRPRTRTGKTFTLHPSGALIERWTEFARRLPRLIERSLDPRADEGRDYYFGRSYRQTTIVPPPQALPQPLQLSGGLRILVHGDPTFMVMDTLKRQFEQIVGTSISQRAFSIDRLRLEALRNAERPTSRYDIVAVDLPWIGEFAEKHVLQPLDRIMDVERLDPADFHTAGWQAAHWKGRPYGVPAQTTPELLFYRRDLFAEAGLEPPKTTDELLAAARLLHAPAQGRYGIAWNAARGTALGHSFMMIAADFDQPIVAMPRKAGGYDASGLGSHPSQLLIDSPGGLKAAEFLLELLRYSPPDILSMSWYERVRPYAAGNVAMAFGYTLLAPYFEMDETSPARETTGYLPHPSASGIERVAPVGGYVLGIPANLAPERREAVVEALTLFTSPGAQKLYVQHGSRTLPRYSVGADPEVRKLSPIFEAVDGMSWRDELQFWPRPPIPQMYRIIQICGEEFHDMLRGIQTPLQAVRRAQERAEEAVRDTTT
ncbi:ABC transporter substrate-binding protein [Aurantimonas sp. VKM B-3413]|uniref:ABC transporter substrate-binding protein n=1 Tax=Aurantimonas sp. VKM B-3413 TaxID=2779401 RepID=UPI001E388E5F|nr:extracellular solute-binding protein [Aurantimonas sp. VKM B-3413]MCB8839946.1 extracellular solute-binding protein [Aurantimonas sp. VKM B-3413]